jgi:hypothetical protein
MERGLTRWRVFEDKEFADQAVVAVEKRIHHEDMEGIDEAQMPVVRENEVAGKIA